MPIYSTLKKILVSESGTRRSSNWANFGRFPGGCKLISEYFEIISCFIDLTNVKVCF